MHSIPRFALPRLPCERSATCALGPWCSQLAAPLKPPRQPVRRPAPRSPTPPPPLLPVGCLAAPLRPVSSATPARAPAGHRAPRARSWHVVDLPHMCRQQFWSPNAVGFMPSILERCDNAASPVKLVPELYTTNAALPERPKVQHIPVRYRTVDPVPDMLLKRHCRSVWFAYPVVDMRRCELADTPADPSQCTNVETRQTVDVSYQPQQPSWQPQPSITLSGVPYTQIV
jgi:hypothetical protein